LLCRFQSSSEVRKITTSLLCDYLVELADNSTQTMNERQCTEMQSTDINRSRRPSAISAWRATRPDHMTRPTRICHLAFAWSLPYCLEIKMPFHRTQNSEFLVEPRNRMIHGVLTMEVTREATPRLRRKTTQGMHIVLCTVKLCPPAVGKI
jgi:hypothetical protein